MLSPKIGEFVYTANVATVPVALPAFGDLPEDTQIFVVEYGLKQYIQDGAAVSKLHTDKDRKGQTKTEEEIAQEKREGVAERVENLTSGTFTRRGTAERVDPETAFRRAYVVEKLKAARAAIGKKAPPLTGPKANPDWYFAPYTKDDGTEMPSRYDQFHAGKNGKALEAAVRAWKKERQEVIDLDGMDVD
jgi:hypothetical protein